MGARSRRFRCSALRGEDGRHLVNALLKSRLRLIPGIFGRVAVLNHGHLRTPIAEVIEADHVLAVIGNSRSQSKISRDQPIALGVCKVEYVRDPRVRLHLRVRPFAVHVSTAELGRCSHRHQRAPADA
jgi:hypothetical protein